MDIEVIYKDEDIIVVEKPFGVPSQADKSGAEDMESYIKDTYGFAGLVHRLDRPVGGVMVYALNSKSLAKLSAEVQEKKFLKTYLAVVMGEAEDEDVLVHWLTKNQRVNISQVSDKNNKNAKRAELKYKCLEKIETKDYGVLSLIEINLMTGRHHQIRVQMASAKLPLWGDTKYNDFFKRGFYNINLGLYSKSIEFENLSKKRVVFEKEPSYTPFDFF